MHVLMAGSTFGTAFKVTTFGESHGAAVGAVIDGLSAGIEIDAKLIAEELARRKGRKPARNEPEDFEILSGMLDGKTLGTPLCIIIRNKDAKPEDYESIKSLFRPGHADYSYFMKFGMRDWRGGGRASGRETAARVAAGAIAKQILSKQGIKISSKVLEIAGEKDAAKMERAIEKASSSGNSVGGIIEISASGVPAGIGEPVFRKLDAEIASALMGIGGVKGVEIGAGFAAARMLGSECNDELFSEKGKIKFRSNNAGGILGGISTGQEIVARLAVKPTPSIAAEQCTVDESGKNAKISVKGRHDACICSKVAVVAESMLALVLIDMLMLQKARLR